MPNAVVIYRPVFGTHDPNPRRGDGYSSGEDWFNFLWPTMHDIPADYFQFVNEWQGNGDGETSVQGYGQFYIELMTACRARGVKCTVGDWSTGTPGWPYKADEAHYTTDLAPMLEKAAAWGFPVNYHCYAPEGAGATDMSAQAELYFMRWEEIAKRHPGIKIIGGEGSNAGKDNTGNEGVFRGLQTLDLMKQARGLILASPYRKNFIAVNWWWWGDPATHSIGEGNWSKDNFSSIAPQFFDWCADSQ